MSVRDRKQQEQDFASLSILETLLEVTQSLVVVRDIESLLQKIAESAGSVLGADVIVLYEYQEETGDVRMAPVLWGDIQHPEVLRGRGRIHKESLVFKMLEKTEPFYAHNAREGWAQFIEEWPPEEGKPGGFVHREGIASSAAMPLIVDKETVGVLFVNYRTPCAFDWEKQRTIELFATQAAMAIQNTRLFEDLGRRVQELATLQEVAKAIITVRDLSEDLHLIAESATRLVRGNAVSSSIYLYDRENDEFLPGEAAGQIDTDFLQQHRPRRDGMGREAIRRGTLYFTNEPMRVNPIMYTRGVRAVAAFPLMTDSGLVGLLYVHFKTEYHLPRNEQQLLTAFADQAATAIERARFYEEIGRRLKQLEVVRKLTLDLDAALGLDEVLNLILQRAVDMVGVKSGSLMLVDSKTGKLKAKARFGPGRATVEEMRTFDIGEGIVGWVAEKGKPYLSSDVSKDERFIPAIDKSIASLRAVPLISQGTVIGVISLDSSELEAFDEGDSQLLEAFAEQVVTAIQNAKRYEAMQRSKAELEAIKEIDRAMGSDRILDLILEKATEITGASAVNIMWFDEATGDLVMEAQKGVFKDKIGAPQKIGQGIVGLAAKNRTPLLVLDVTAEPWSGIYLRFIPNIRSELAVPMLAGDKLIGVLNVEDPEISAFDEDDVRLLEALAMQAVLAIQKAEQYEELQETRAALQEEQKKRILMEKLIMFNNLAANLAHRVGNELGTIPICAREIADLLPSDLPHQKLIMHYLHRIEEDSERFLGTAERLRKPFKPGLEESTDVSLLLATALRRATIPPNIQVTTDYMPRLPSVQVISSQLIDVFKNIISNAVEAMPEGGPLTIKSRLSVDEEGRWVVVEIADTGCGMEEGVRKRVFELFYSTKMRGLGFGLWWCRTLLQQLGGDIRVESEPGKGSTFYVVVPVEGKK